MGWGPRRWDSIPIRVKNISLLQIIQNDSGIHPVGRAEAFVVVKTAGTWS